MKEQYINECKQIQQNCLYTAEAHHQIAVFNRGLAYIFQVVPAIVAAISGSLVASGSQPTSKLWITVVASVITAITSVLDPNKKYQEHLNAARGFTALKHDARFLHEAQSHKLSDEAFTVCVEHLHEKYNDLLKATPATNKWAMRCAQKVVKADTHEPDRNKDGSLK